MIAGCGTFAVTTGTAVPDWLRAAKHSFRRLFASRYRRQSIHGGGDDSPFTRALLAHFQIPGLELSLAHVGLHHQIRGRLRGGPDRFRAACC